jgi:hypothetical protein
MSVSTSLHSVSVLLPVLFVMPWASAQAAQETSVEISDVIGLRRATEYLPMRGALHCLPLTVELFHQLAFFILSCKPTSYCRFKRIDVYIL